MQGFMFSGAVAVLAGRAWVAIIALVQTHEGTNCVNGSLTLNRPSIENHQCGPGHVQWAG